MAAPTPTESARHPYLSLVNEVDNVPVDYDFGQLFKLLLPGDDRPHGFVAPRVVDKMAWSSAFVVDQSARTIQLVDSSGGTATAAACNEAFQTTIDAAIASNAFSILHGEHSELIPVLGANQPVVLERFTAPLFGIAQRGAHMTAFTRPAAATPGEESPPLKIWVARRSRAIFAYPGMLDSTVAGGVKAGDAPFACIVAEAHEEASLPPSFVRKHAKSTGFLSYVAQDSDMGFVAPTVVYVYDIELPAGVVPTVNDDEVEGFYLWTVQEVLDAMARREFKPNSAIVMIDFFIRHGILTQENVPDYIDLATRLRRPLPVPVAPIQPQ